VVLTLALGIGANAAIFALVRGVLLRPLVNRDEDRLIYIRQSAKGLGVENTTFSVPEILDLRARIKSLSAFGDFSSIGFTMVGLGEPREVRAGVVGGSYFEVMGLHPVLGRLLDMRDDGPSAQGAMVLTYRFWTTALKSDPSVLGKTVQLGERVATVVGVVEPSVPYPAETEIMSNIVTSPHHLSATMVTGRVHRMTELFGRLAPGTTLEQARAELQTVHAGIVKEHPDAYSAKADVRIEAARLRDQITSQARTILLVLLAASVLVFIIACSNVANLILARTVRRENELAIRAALGAGTAALRRTLLAESLLLCGAGAALGVLSARRCCPFWLATLTVLGSRARSHGGFQHALGGGAAGGGCGRCCWRSCRGCPRRTARRIRLASVVCDHANTARRQRVFAITQIAASFVLLAGASMLLKTLLALQAAPSGFDTRQVLAINVPVMSYGKTHDQIVGFYRETIRRITDCRGGSRGCRDGGSVARGASLVQGSNFRRTAMCADRARKIRGRFRTISPGFFAALGVPIIAGRDFNDGDRKGGEPVVIVSQSLARRMFRIRMR
jgi:predicted permease